MKHNHHNHCWHIIHEMHKQPEDMHREICCWCGTRRIQPADSQASGIHGPHAPKPVVVGPTEFKGEGIA